jgi:hypothetical protein
VVHLARQGRPGFKSSDPFDPRAIEEFKWDEIPSFNHLKLEQDRLRLRYRRLINYQLPELKSESPLGIKRGPEKVEWRLTGLCTPPLCNRATEALRSPATS